LKCGFRLRTSGLAVRRDGLDLDAHVVPGLLQLGHESGRHGVAVLDRLAGEVGDAGAAGDAVGAAVRLPPDVRRLLPGVATHGVGEQGEGLVRDAAVDVHAAVVARAAVELAVVVGLRVLAQLRIVVGGARGDHRTQGDALDGRAEDALADQPVRLVDRLLVEPLLVAGAHDVGEALVQRAGLAVVVQTRGVLGDAVRQLVADHVGGDEGDEDDTVAVAVGHAGAVPEGVVVVATVVDGAHQVHAVAVDGVPAEFLLEEVAHAAVVVVGIVGGLVAGGLVAFEASTGAGQARRVLGVVDLALGLAGGEAVGDAAGGSSLSDLLGFEDGGDEGQRGVRVEPRDVVQQVGRDEAVQGTLGHGTFLFVYSGEVNCGLKSKRNCFGTGGSLSTVG